VRFAEFSQIFGNLNFSKHSCLVKDKPVQEWLAIVNAANEAERDKPSVMQDPIRKYLYD
jgi:hypothetical protein